MSTIIGVIAIAFLILGILLFFGLRSLQKQTDTTLHSPDGGKKLDKAQNTGIPDSKEVTTKIVPPPPRISSVRVVTPTAVQDAKRTVTQISQDSKDNTLLWAGMETPITVHGYAIQNPLVYWSRGSVSPDEASCLDITLPVGQSCNPDTPPLPYWPCYSQLTPDQRARYLLWLSTGKDSDLEEIGYAFLYFYGLEKRALIDKRDLDSIVPEVQRLLERYRASRSFNAYLGSFIAYMAALRLENLSEGDIREYFSDMTTLTESMTMVGLAWYAQKGKPLPWQLAYSVARHFSGVNIPSAVKKENSYLEKLFRARYLSMFSGGLSVVPAKNPYRLEYKPASPSILTNHSNIPGKTVPTIEPCPIPNPLGRKKQFSNLFSLLDNCVQDVKPFVTQLSKGKGAITWQTYASLPEELRATIPHPDQDAWDRLFEEHRQEKTWALVTTSSLAEVIGLENRYRLTVVQSRNLVQTVRDGGYIILPDIRHAGNSYQWDETLALLPLPADSKGDLSPSFPSYALMLELGVGIAASDGYIDPTEQAHLHTFFEENFVLSSFEKQCLEALEDLYYQKPPSLTRLGKRLKEGLDPDTRLSVARYLVGMTTADGIIDPKEKKNLDRIFKAMEIEEGYLHWLLARSGKVDPADAPVVVHSGTEYTDGESIPLPGTEIAPSFAIDESAVAKIQTETMEVSAILDKIFTKEETDSGGFVLGGENEPKNIRIHETSSSEYFCMEGLQPRYVPVLEKLLTAEVWTRDEFVHLVQCHNCMPQATLEAINIWAEAELGDFLLEDDDGSVRVDRDLIES